MHAIVSKKLFIKIEKALESTIVTKMTSHDNT